MGSSRENKRVGGYVGLLICVLLTAYGLSRVPSIVLWREPGEPVGFYMFGSTWANVRPVLLKDAPIEFEVNEEIRNRYPFENFAFRFETERGFLIDTFDGFVGKDMGAPGDTTVAVELSQKTLREIYEKALAIRAFDYPEPRLPFGCDNFDGHSVGEVKLTIRSGDALKTYSWHAGNRFCGRYYDEWTRLYSLIEMMMFAGRTSEEYRALPRSRAAYV